MARIFIMNTANSKEIALRFAQEGWGNIDLLGFMQQIGLK
jgi:hypothetical protein